MLTPKIISETKVVFGPCRLSYTHVFNKYTPEGGTAEDGKYMTNVLIPKTEKETIKAIQTAIENAKKSAIVSKYPLLMKRKSIAVCGPLCPSPSTATMFQVTRVLPLASTTS